jgi:hypothetical protein
MKRRKKGWQVKRWCGNGIGLIPRVDASKLLSAMSRKANRTHKPAISRFGTSLDLEFTRSGAPRICYLFSRVPRE